MKVQQMKFNNQCPECEKVLAANAKRCRCGWKSNDELLIEPIIDHRCQFAIGNRRCPLDGTNCPYPYGKGPWYCFDHWRKLHDPVASAAFLDYAEEHYHDIIAKYKKSRIHDD